MKTKLLKFFLLLLSVFAMGNVTAADITGALTNVADPTITYKSVDANNNEITLSAKLYYKTNKNVDLVILNCHPTITHDAGCPTGKSPQMEAIKYMASENALVICPDYIGFGQTKGTVHPYMCATLTARNVLDCYKAAIKYVKETGKRTINANYYTINIGYSQGGATALAFQRYLETEATDADRALVNLAGSVCGAGPYDQNIIFDTYEKMDELDYPVLMAYVLRGHKEAFGKTTMRNLELKECFSPKFWDYYTKTLEGVMDAKEKNVDEINEAIKAAGFTTFKSIMNANYFEEKNGVRTHKVYRIIRKTLEQSNLLAEGWTPKAPITFYHDKAGHDIVVPYAETEAAVKFVNKAGGKCSYVDAIDDYGYDGSGKYYVVTVSVTGENYLWHAAVFRDYYEDEKGNRNNTYQGQATVMTLAVLSGNESYKFSSLDHRTFGARFYAQFLGVRASMRPNLSNPTYFNTIKGKGTASTQNVAIATPTTKAYTATDASVAGNYDVITTAMPYAIPANDGVFVQFPDTVDGYYFGCDAPRYEVTLNKNGEATKYTRMTDLADFEAGKVYYIESEKAETEPVVSMTAGVQTASVECPLNWRVLNIRPLNGFGGKSYATAYLPFAYTTDKAYAIKDNGTSVNATAVEEVPAGTGVLLVDESAAETCCLEVLFENPDATDSDLKGTYTGISNNNYLTFGRNADKTEVGFYKYNGTTIKPFSCYLENTTGSNGRQIDFAEPTGIESVVESVVTEVYSLDGKRQRGITNGVNLVRSSNGMVKKVIK